MTYSKHRTNRVEICADFVHDCETSGLVDNFRFLVVMRLNIIIGLLVLLSIQTATASSLYKWVDDNGNIVYSQTMPPPGAKVLQQPRISGLRTPPPPPVTEGESAPQQSETADNTTTPSPETQPPETSAAEQQEQLREYCDNLRKNLELLKMPKRVYVPTDDGGRQYLSDEEREEKILSTDEKISTYCQEN